MACRTVGRWITENVRRPVERFVERAEEACTEARRWVEREIREPIERRRTTVERRCRRRECNWWCLCCNKWFCWLETIIEVIVEWVVKVVGEWLVELVCEIVVKVIKIVVDVIVTVVKFVVTAVVCLFTEPLGALEALGDLWLDITSIIRDIGDLVVDLLDAVSDLLDLTKETILDLGDLLGPLGRFFLGIVAGALDIVRRVVDGAAKIVDGVFEIVVGILTLDFCRALEGFVKGVALGALQAVLGVTGVLSLASNGARDGFVRDGLRNRLQNLLNDRFDGEMLEQVEDALKMDSSSFGVKWSVVPFICTISSRSATVDLRTMHQAGTVNLFEAAGYAPIGCSQVISRSVYKLVYEGTSRTVSLKDIRDYLEGDDQVPEFTLLAGSKENLKDMLQIAKRKFTQMAIYLDIKPLEYYEIADMSEFLINGATPICNAITTRFGLSDICDLPSGFVFGYQPPAGSAISTLNGLASVYWRGERRTTTGATSRDGFIVHVFGVLMAHEMGHCFSLCHAEHHGMEHIMFTNAAGGNNCGVDDPTITTGGRLTQFTQATVIEYLMIGGEPRFTLEDGENAWRWILEEAFECVPLD